MRRALPGQRDLLDAGPEAAGGLPDGRVTERVSRRGIASVEPLIRPYVRRTPVVTLDRADFGLAPGPLTLKLEQLQHAGSFKARGAFANLLLRHIPAAGVVAASGGNHGVAVAYAAGVLGVRARIFVPTVSSAAKIARIRGYGAELVVGGDTYADALSASAAAVADAGALPVHAYDQVETMLGAGTLGLELEEQAGDAATILVAVGGGGLIAGVAAWYAGRARVIAVEPDTAPTLTMARQAGRPVDAPAGGIAVDSLAPRRVGERNFPVIERFVEDVLLVTDDEIRRAQRALWETARIVAEPGGGAALAAVLSGRYEPAPDENVAVVVSGANTTAVDFTD
jgi:threonine dehydratase